VGEVNRSVSQPSAALLSQSPQPWLHWVTSHVPPLQPAVAFGTTHAAQEPQWPGSVFVSASQPLLSTPSQSLYGPVHWPTAQVPLAHTGTALGSEHGVHSAPHELTLALSAQSVPQRW
jgi:hypothetical protein